MRAATTRVTCPFQRSSGVDPAACLTRWTRCAVGSTTGHRRSPPSAELPTASVVRGATLKNDAMMQLPILFTQLLNAYGSQQARPQPLIHSCSILYVAVAACVSCPCAVAVGAICG